MSEKITRRKAKVTRQDKQLRSITSTYKYYTLSSNGQQHYLGCIPESWIYGFDLTESVAMLDNPLILKARLEAFRDCGYLVMGFDMRRIRSFELVFNLLLHDLAGHAAHMLPEEYIASQPEEDSASNEGQN